MARVAQPAPQGDPPPTPDPLAVHREYRRHRARREIRSARLRERRNAHVRFFLAIALLLALSIAFGLAAWRQVEQLFGL
jgi:hypothetical protein